MAGPLGVTAEEAVAAMREMAGIGTETVTIDRARFDRLAAVAELAHEWINAPEDSSIGRRAEDALTHAVDALQSGDLDPLP